MARLAAVYAANRGYQHSMSNTSLSNSDEEAHNWMQNMKHRYDSYLHERGMDLAKSMSMKEQQWSPCRRRVHTFVRRKKFDIFLSVVILANMVVTIVETDATAAGQNEGLEKGLEIAGNVFLSIYILELVLKMYAFRWGFIQDTWNVLDFLIVALDVTMVSMQFVMDERVSFGFLRTVRLCRLTRAFKAAKALKELRELLRGFLGAMKAITCGLLMIGLIMIVWSILAVQMVNPLVGRIAENEGFHNCPRCPVAFSSVFESVKTFFFLCLTNDSWGELAAPIMEEEAWTFAFFLFVLVSVQLVMLNLILAVIVQAALTASSQDVHEAARRAKDDRQRAEDHLVALCSAIDIDGDGFLSKNEFMNAWSTHKGFRDCLQALHFDEFDLHTIFKILDIDGSGRVSYSEFVQQLRRMQMQMPQLILYELTEVLDGVRDIAKRWFLEGASSSSVLTSTATVSASQTIVYSTPVAAKAGTFAPDVGGASHHAIPEPVLRSGKSGGASSEDFDASKGDVSSLLALGSKMLIAAEELNATAKASLAELKKPSESSDMNPSETLSYGMANRATDSMTLRQESMESAVAAAAAALPPDCSKGRDATATGSTSSIQAESASGSPDRCSGDLDKTSDLDAGQWSLERETSLDNSTFSVPPPPLVGPAITRS
eukprot:TRINITY_DN19308_c0_g2_i2.p1 TRINITY_DN19308_c0_g2~~TRINITY_DN19308_c0_g2_i2.p1  ORF type:complete len:659 (+),score=147.04 TRINITY_DN19308_c0_g2_i2:101-2077(+)